MRVGKAARHARGWRVAMGQKVRRLRMEVSRSPGPEGGLVGTKIRPEKLEQTQKLEKLRQVEESKGDGRWAGRGRRDHSQGREERITVMSVVSIGKTGRGIK